MAAKHADVVKRLQKLADGVREELGDTAKKVKGRGVRQPGNVS